MEFRGKYDFLSNFYPVNITIDNITYPSVENAYQAMKCENPDDRYAFVGISPTEAKRFGQSVKMKQDFKRNRVKIMEKLLHEKFKDENLMKRLTEIDGEIAEDNHWNDKFWGRTYTSAYGKFEGENMLGKLLMCVRDNKEYHGRMS